jgi:hypothetical protein
MSDSGSIHDLVVAALSDMGVPSPDSVIETLRVEDGCFVGHFFRYDGGYATQWLGSPTVEFYDEDGNLLKVVGTTASRIEQLCRESSRPVAWRNRKKGMTP